ncbi:MAG: hypothetical protein KJ718_03375 [Nanoarchaeota archaeon]|nr:hypothetical protein [Nanoarchaeota archaeon]MBU1051570.1 hypothetical protein [Nanoarchaeota archaeon]MBU1989043.1 hypothetical protein [Nanoarchaeota archaeon]
MAEPFVYGGQTILSHPIFVETILPFLLIFTIVFAVLQKSKILGEGKKQIDAIVALVVGLLVISFAQATGVIIQMIPFLAVSLVALLVLMILIGSFWSGGLPKPLQYVLIAVITIAVVIALMFFTNAWTWLLDLIYTGGDSSLFINSIFIIIIAAAIVVVIIGAGKANSSDK